MKYKYPPEEILSHSFFINNPEEFYKFYKDKMNCLENSPNIIHKYLADLEKEGKLKGVITQNIDGLHQIAGSKKVIELHGSIHRNYCTKCGRFYSLKEMLSLGVIPLCPHCKGIIKPDVTLYQEMLNEDSIENAINALRKADLLIVAGTSLKVYPANGLINYYRGNRIIVINKEPLYLSNITLEINEPVGETFSQISV